MTPEQEIERAGRARRLIEDELFVDAKEKLRASILKAFEDSRPEDTSQRERLYLEMKLLKSLVKDLETIMQTGELAGRQIERQSR